MQEGQERRIEIKEAKPWMVARVIQWAYIGTFNRVCSEHIYPRLFRPDFQELVGNASHTEEYAHDSEEDALISVYNVSAEVYELGQRFIMRDLCDFIASGMMERYRQQLFTSWPSPVFVTLQKASEELDSVRAKLSTIVAAQTFSTAPDWFISLRLRSMIAADHRFACEVLWRTQYLGERYQTAMDSMLPRTWQSRSKTTALRMQLSGQDQALTNLRFMQSELARREMNDSEYVETHHPERHFPSADHGSCIEADDFSLNNFLYAEGVPRLIDGYYGKGSFSRTSAFLFREAY